MLDTSGNDAGRGNRAPDVEKLGLENLGYDGGNASLVGLSGGDGRGFWFDLRILGSVDREPENALEEPENDGIVGGEGIGDVGRVLSAATPLETLIGRGVWI